MSNCIACVERWSPSYSMESLEVIENSDLATLVAELDGEQSAILSIECDDQSVILSVFDGSWTVTALLGEDEFFDLIGDGSLEGEVDFVQGGQIVDQPQRHIVSSADALEVASGFLNEGTIEMVGGRWERQV